MSGQDRLSGDQVVWVSPHLTASPRSGGDLRTHRLLQSLAQVADVTLYVVGPEVDTEALRTATGAGEVHWTPPTGGGVARARALANRWPVAAARAFDADVATAVAARVACGARLVCDHLYTATYAVGGLPHLLHLHNAEASRIAELPRPQGAFRRLNRAWDRAVLPGWERAVISRSGARVVVVSEEDGRRLGVEAVVVPNGADLQPARTAPSAGSLLFVGALDYEPNRQAVMWWSREIWPALPPGTPPLTVVGRQADLASSLAGLPGVALLGEIADLRAVLSQASIAVIPLLHGGGSRLKVLEALAWSVPVLATPKAIEGLGLAPGRDVAVAANAPDFSSLLLQLWGDPRRRAELGAAGRVAVASLGWETIGRRFTQIVDNLT